MAANRTCPVCKRFIIRGKPSLSHTKSCKYYPIDNRICSDEVIHGYCGIFENENKQCLPKQNYIGKNIGDFHLEFLGNTKEKQLLTPSRFVLKYNKKIVNIYLNWYGPRDDIKIRFHSDVYWLEWLEETIAQEQFELTVFRYCYRNNNWNYINGCKDSFSPDIVFEENSIPEELRYENMERIDVDNVPDRFIERVIYKGVNILGNTMTIEGKKFIFKIHCQDSPTDESRPSQTVPEKLEHIYVDFNIKSENTDNPSDLISYSVPEYGNRKHAWVNSITVDGELEGIDKETNVSKKWKWNIKIPYQDIYNAQTWRNYQKNWQTTDGPVPDYNKIDVANETLNDVIFEITNGQKYVKTPGSLLSPHTTMRLDLTSSTTGNIILLKTSVNNLGGWINNNW